MFVVQFNTDYFNSIRVFYFNRDCRAGLWERRARPPPWASPWAPRSRVRKLLITRGHFTLQWDRTRHGNMSYPVDFRNHRPHGYSDKMQSGLTQSLPIVFVVCSLGIALLIVGLIGTIAFALVKRRRGHADPAPAEQEREKENSSIARLHRRNSAFLLQVCFSHRLRSTTVRLKS